MPLPSQSARPVERRAHMSRRSRRRRLVRMLIVTAVVLVTVGGFWILWPSSASPSLPAARPDATARMDDEAIEPPESKPVETRIDPATVTAESARADEDAAPPKISAPKPQPSLGRATEDLPPAVDPAWRSEHADDAVDRGRRAFTGGMDELARNEPIEARRLLSLALRSGSLSADEAAATRQRLAELNERLVFSPEIVAGDGFAFAYAVESGDSLSIIPRKLGVLVDWRFIQRINHIGMPERIRQKQRLKIVTGPFSAVVNKREFRLDLYLGEGSRQVYVRSFDVGLGEFNSTPEGRFRVKPEKLLNPEWINPRTRRLYLPDDPDNPIGEHWIGLAPDEEHLAGAEGYGLHGTIEPDSIGRQSSMGCIRMRPEDVAIVWELLAPNVSTVEIRP